MRDKEIVGLYQAYLDVYSNSNEEVEQLDEISKDRADAAVLERIARTGRAFDREMRDRTPENMRDTVDAVDKETRAKRLAAGVRTRRNAEQNVNASYEYDTFDAILEHLVAEGYADTNESALAIMANMSEEWKQNIVEQQVPIHPAEDAFNKSTPEDRAVNMKKYNTPYKPLDTSRSNGTGGAPAWMRGGFKSPDEYNKLDPKTKAMLD